MDRIRQIFRSERAGRSNRRFLSRIFNKKQRDNLQKALKINSLPTTLSDVVRVPLPEAIIQTLASKFKDHSWGTTYKANKKTIILDLDNTLICASKDVPFADKFTHITLEKDGEYTIRYIVKRPGLLKFLRKISKLFNVCIYTSAEETYARKIVEVTEISEYIYTIYDRSHCEKVNDFLCVKDIFNLGFDPKDAILVDDFALQLAYQPDNSIQIKPFEGNLCDQELYHLCAFLESIHNIDDVRSAKINFENFLQNKHSYMKIKTSMHVGEECDSAQIDVDEGCRNSGEIPTLNCRMTMMKQNNYGCKKNATTSCRFFAKHNFEIIERC